MRNGNRWRVTGIDTQTKRLAAERLDDRARVVLGGDYLREHITYGYAVTVHSAQGVTADTTHAVLGETTTHTMFYVALTRGCETNTAHLYERASEQEYGQTQPEGMHIIQRHTTHHARTLARAIIANDDDQPVNAHDTAAQIPNAALPVRVRHLVDRRTAAVDRRRATNQAREAQSRSFAHAMEKAREPRQT